MNPPQTEYERYYCVLCELRDSGECQADLDSSCSGAGARLQLRLD